MQISKRQLYAIVIIFFMVTSTIGFLNLSNQSTQAPPEGVVPDIPGSGQATTLAYEANGVESIALEVFPTAIMLAKTSEFDIATANQKLLAVPGVQTVQSGEFISPIAGRSENFRAQIVLESAQNAVQTLDAISSSGSFTETQLFLQALVSVPSEVEFKNASLDLTQKHTFADPKVQAFVNANTGKGDDLLVSLNATFEGQAFVSVTAFEEQNLSKSPQLYFAAGTYTISSLENDFFIRANATYSEQNNLQNAKQEIESDFNAQIEVQPLSSDVSVEFADASKFFAQDLETFLDSFEGVSDYQLSLDLNTALITFEQDVDYASFKARLRADLDSLGFTVKEIADPQVSLQGSVSGADKEELLAKISAAENSNSVSFEVLQKAIINADSIFIADENASFALPAGSFDAFVKTTRKEGEQVSLSLLVIGNKQEGILQVQAQEEETQA